MPVGAPGRDADPHLHRDDRSGGRQLQFEEWFLEEPVTEFRAFGRMTATISAGGVSGFLDGYIRGIVTNADGRGNRVVTCTAPDHAVMFAR